MFPTLLSVALAAGPATSPWEGEPFAAPPAEVAAAAAALVVTEQKHVDWLLVDRRDTFEPGGRVATVARILMRPLSVEGARAMSIFQFPWLPWVQERPSIRARVISPAGVEHLLDQSTLSDVTAGSQSDQVLMDVHMLRAPLPGVEVGAVLEIEVRSSQQEVLPGAGFYLDYGLTDVNVRHVSIVVDAPSGLPSRHAAHGLEAPQGVPRQLVQGGRRTLAWNWSPGPKVTEPEPDAPQDGIPGAWVAVSTAASWSAVAAAYAAVVERQLAGADVSALASEITAGARGRDEAAGRILEWMGQRLRYTHLALGASVAVPARPAEVLSRRYGDCKDLSLLFTALMRSLGHKADLALVRAKRGDVDPGLPALGVFDHAIVRLGGDGAGWIDPTFPDLPVGLVPSQLEGKLALVARGGASELVMVPFNPAGAYRMSVEREVRMRKAGLASVTEVASVEGVMAAESRRQRRGSTSDQLRTADLKEARERLATEAVTVEVEAPKGGPLVGRSTGFDSKWGSATDDAAEARLDPRPLRCLPDSLVPWTGNGKAPRRGPLEVVQPCDSELRYRVIPASGLEAVQPLPPGLVLREGAFGLEASYLAQADGSITSRLHLVLGRGTLTGEQVTRIRAALAPFGKDGRTVKFERTSQRLLEAGRGREALDEIRRLLAAEPDEVGHRLRLAAALRRLGLGEAARGEARRGVEVAPGSWRAQRVLADVLEADLVGRRLEPGCDLSGAVAAQRKAVELEPARTDTRAYLGALLLFGEDCRFLARGADPAEAVTVLLHSPGIVELPGRAEDLMRALLATGRDADAVDLARKRPQGRHRDAVLVAGVALLEGAGAAAREAARLPPGERGETARAASVHLARRRDYQLAAEVLEKAAVGADDVARYQAMAANLRRTERLDQHPPDPSTPRGLAGELARAGAGLEPIEGLVAQARGQTAPWMPVRFARILVGEVSWAGPPEVVADLAAAQTLRWEPDGADGGQLTLGPIRVYLVKESGRWRILACFGESLLMARHAVALLDRGQVEAARRWLEWAIADAKRYEAWATEVVTPLQVGPQSPPESLRLLACALGGLEPAAELELLESARASDPPAKVRTALLLQIGDAHLEAGRYDQALAAAVEVLRDDPGSILGPGLRLRALARMGRIDEVRRLATLAVNDPALKPEALREISQRASEAGAIAEGVALRARVAEISTPTASDLNNQAWARLFIDDAKGLGSARAEAQRAVEQAPRARSSQLNTLAAVLAETGEPEQAMVTLRKGVAVAGGLDNADWVVIGRVAEAYGMPAEARRAYQRVEKPSRPSATSAWALAQRWLARLEAGDAKAPAAAGAALPR